MSLTFLIIDAARSLVLPNRRKESREGCSG